MPVASAVTGVTPRDEEQGLTAAEDAGYDAGYDIVDSRGRFAAGDASSGQEVAIAEVVEASAV